MKKIDIRDGTPETNSHWTQLDGSPMEVYIDFHHTISTKCGACEGEDINALSAGVPQKGAYELLQGLKRMGFKVTIFTGYRRVSEASARIELCEWLASHDLLQFIDEVDVTKPKWAFFIGDRGVYHTSCFNSLAEVKRRFATGDLKR